MNKVRAIYGNGVFRPEGRIELPEGTTVELDIRLVQAAAPPINPEKKISAINAILAEQQRLLHKQPVVRRTESRPS